MDKDNIIQKIKALQKKTVSNGATIEEENSAKIKVAELMSKYKINYNDLNSYTNYQQTYTYTNNNTNNNQNANSNNSKNTYTDYWENEIKERQKREKERTEKLRQEEETLKNIKINQEVKKYAYAYIFVVTILTSIFLNPERGVDFIKFNKEILGFLVIYFIYYLIKKIIRRIKKKDEREDEDGYN